MKQLCNAAYAISVENLDQAARKSYDAELTAPIRRAPASPIASGAVGTGAADAIRAIRLGAGQARR